jgi:hypothetical protein
MWMRQRDEDKPKLFQKWTSWTSVGVSGWPVSSATDISLVDAEGELATLLLVVGRICRDATSDATTRSMWRTTCSATAGSTRVRAQTEVKADAAEGELRPRTAALILAVARTDGRLRINSGSATHPELKSDPLAVLKLCHKAHVKVINKCSVPHPWRWAKSLVLCTGHLDPLLRLSCKAYRKTTNFQSNRHASHPSPRNTQKSGYDSELTNKRKWTPSLHYSVCKLILTVNNTFCFATINQAFYYVASVLTCK